MQSGSRERRMLKLTQLAFSVVAVGDLSAGYGTAHFRMGLSSSINSVEMR